MQIENGALKITNNICSLCNENFTNFVDHLVVKNHLNHQFLTKEFCSALSLNSKFASSQTVSLSATSLQTLIFYLKSHKLPLYFKQLYSCHKCFLIFDSINLLFSHLNKCDSNKASDDNGTEKLNDSITVSDISIHSNEKILDDESHDSDVEIVAEIYRPSICTQDIPCSEKVKSKLPDKKDIKGKDQSNNNQMKQIEISENGETLILKTSASFIPRSKSPAKEFISSLKNGYAQKPILQSRSNKRLLRNLSKKPEPKRVDSKSNTKKKKEELNDTFIVTPTNKRKYNKICGFMVKSLKCRICNRGNFKHEQNLNTHYQNVHNFFTLQPQSELMLSRFTANETKYYHFRCLACLKMFENFTNLSQHRCKYYFKQIHIPKKLSDKHNNSMSKPISNLVIPDTLPDYESESEFFNNIGLVRKNHSTSKCEHTKSRQENISNKLKTTKIEKTETEQTEKKSTNSKECVQVKSANPGRTLRNGITSKRRVNKPICTMPDFNLSDDVIISVVPRATSSK